MQKTGSVRGVRSQRAGKRTSLGLREKQRLIQLALCVGLFLVVFLGKGVAPEGIAQSGEKPLQIIRSDTDFKSVFSALGEAVSNGEPVLETLGGMAVEVFGLGGGKQEALPPAVKMDGPISQAAREALAQPPAQQEMLARLGISVPAAEPAGEGAEPETEPEPSPSPAPQIPVYTGPALPEGATMDYVDLELSNTVTPVMGVMTSPYGYRDHPVSGEYLFHAGTDVAADTGTPVAAFADGTVDFIGESDAYGLYIQLDHGNGVTSFYCHCSALYAHKGETVTKGQTIAAVGETGNATGPHLHLELKRDGVLLNPIYYIETEG